MSLYEYIAVTFWLIVIGLQIGIAISCFLLDRRMGRIEEARRVSDAAHAAVARSLIQQSESENA